MKKNLKNKKNTNQRVIPDTSLIVANYFSNVNKKNKKFPHFSFFVILNKRLCNPESIKKSPLKFGGEVFSVAFKPFRLLRHYAFRGCVQPRFPYPVLGQSDANDGLLPLFRQESSVPQSRFL